MTYPTHIQPTMPTPLQQTELDKQAIESLAPRIKALSESFCVPIPLGDDNEKEREENLGL